MSKYKIYDIPNYEDYELHYSTEVQLIWSKRNERYLKLCKNKDGYLRVCLYKNGKRKEFKIHRLVWQCIKGNIPKDLQINHIDENKLNNCIENLELVTPKQNSNHGTRNARVAKAMIGKFINRQDQSKPIVGIKKDLSEILQYPSTHEASRDKERGFWQQAICQCCFNKRKSHKDFIWFFKEDFDSYMNRFQGNLEDVIKYKLSLNNN